MCHNLCPRLGNISHLLVDSNSLESNHDGIGQTSDIMYFNEYIFEKYRQGYN